MQNAYAQVSQVLSGPNIGCTALVFWNDMKDRRYESNHKKYEGHHREVDGPIASLSKKISNHPVEWLYWYMINELVWSEGTVRSAMNGVS